MTEFRERSSRRPRRRAERWQVEFPYDWEQDAAVSRREVLRLAMLASGALFAGTVALAFLGRRDDRRRGQPALIPGGLDLPEGEALYFNYPGEHDQAILLNLPDTGLVAFSQKCTHLSCSVYFGGEGDLICPCHDGVFDARTGAPTAGPPQRALPRILLEERDGQLFALEEAP